MEVLTLGGSMETTGWILRAGFSIAATASLPVPNRNDQAAEDITAFADFPVPHWKKI